MLVPFTFAPAYARQVWTFVADEIVGRMLRDALNVKFCACVRAYVDGLLDHPIAGDSLDLHSSDGRIMLRRPGYVIAPHRDPKWGFITGLVYLAREGDNEAYGTQLYRVRGDGAAPNDKPFYVEEGRCTLVHSVPFRRNTLLAFLNSTGAHGASIPPDAQPPSLERYVYQFRLGPDKATIARLLAQMPPQRRAEGGGAKAQRAAPASA